MLKNAVDLLNKNGYLLKYNILGDKDYYAKSIRSYITEQSVDILFHPNPRTQSNGIAIGWIVRSIILLNT